MSYLEENHYSPDYDVSEYMTVLGDQKINPYSVSFMIEARDNLVIDGVLQPGEVTDEDLSPTHYYVRFEPQNEDEVKLLAENEEVFVFDYPLDYEVVYSGIYYIDPTVPENQPTYQYAVVSVDQQLPNIPYFILDYYLLEPLDQEDLTPFFMFHFPILEIETHRITGINLIKIPSGWEPSGTINAYDTTKKHWVSTNASVTIFFPDRNDYFVIKTDKNGHFRLGRTVFTPNVEYSVTWRSGRHFRIHPGKEKSMARLGPVKKTFEDWNVYLNDDSNPENRKQWLYAHTYRAAHNYLDLGFNMYDIDPDFKNLSMGVFDEKHSKGYAGYFQASKSPPVRFYFGGNSSNQKMFGIITHEMAHAHHHSFAKKTWKDIDGRIAEAWANLIEYFFTYEIHPTYDGFYQKLSLNDFYCKHKNVNYSKKYSAIGIDLAESIYINLPYSTFNQERRYFFETDTYPADQVQGYPIFMIKNSIKNIKDFSKWKNALISQYPDNPTNFYLDQLFDQYKKKENVNWKNSGDPGC